MELKVVALFASKAVFFMELCVSIRYQNKAVVFYIVILNLTFIGLEFFHCVQAIVICVTKYEIGPLESY